MAAALSFTVVFVRPEIATGSYSFTPALSSSESGSTLQEAELKEEGGGPQARSSIPGVTAIEAACLLPNGQVVRVVRQRILERGFRIADQRQILLTRADVHKLFRYERERLTDATAFSEFVDSFTRGPCLVLLLEHPTEDAVVVAHELLGMWDPVIARKEALSGSIPHDQWPLRALCGHTPLQNGLQSSVNRDCAYRERFFAFPPHSPRLERALVVLLLPFLTTFPEGKAMLMTKLNQQQIIVTHLLEAKELSGEEIALLARATASGAPNQDSKGLVQLQTIAGSGASSTIIGLEGLDLNFSLRSVLGPALIQTARIYASDSVRAQFPTIEDSEIQSPAQSNDVLSMETGTLVVWDPKSIAQLLKDKGEIETTLGLIKPGTASDPLAVAAIQQSIREFGFTIEKQRRLRLTKDQAASFYGEHVAKPFFERLLAFMTSGEIVVMQLARPHAIRCWRGLMGPTNAILARETHPWTLRARFGVDGTRNATHGSDAAASARRELRFFFGEHLHAAAPESALTAAHVARSSLPPSYPAGLTLEKVLTEGMSEMLSLKATDPLEACRWLGQWLLAQRDRQLQLTARESETQERKLVNAGMLKTKPLVQKKVHHGSGSIVLAFTFTYLSVDLETRRNVRESVRSHAVAHDYEFVDVRSMAAKEPDSSLAMRSVINAMMATGKRRFVLFDFDLERFASVYDLQANEHDVQMVTLVEFASVSKPSSRCSSWIKPWIPCLTHELSVEAEDRAATLQSMLAGVFEPSVVIVHDDPKRQTEWREIAQHFGFRICVFDDLVDRKVEQERQPNGPWTQWKRTGAKLQPELVLSLIQQLIHRPFQLFGTSGNQEEDADVSCVNRLLLVGFPWEQLGPNAIEQAIGSPLHRVLHVRNAGDAEKDVPWMAPFVMRGLVQTLESESDAGIPLERLTHALAPVVGLCLGRPQDHDRIHSQLQSHLSRHQFSWINFYDLETALGSTNHAIRTLRRLLLAGNAAGRKRTLVCGFPRTKAEAELWLATLPRPSFVADMAPAKFAVDAATSDALRVFAADPHIRQAQIGQMDDSTTAALVRGLLFGKRVSCVAGDHNTLQLDRLRSMLGPSGFSVLDLRSQWAVSAGLTTKKLQQIVDALAATHAPRCLVVGGFDRPAFFKALEEHVGTAADQLVLLKQIPIQSLPRRNNIADGDDEDYDSDEEEREKMRLAQARAWSPAMLDLQQSFAGSSASTWRIACLAFMHADRLNTQIQTALRPRLIAVVGHPSTFYAQAVATCCRRRQIACVDIQALSSQRPDTASASRSIERRQMKRPFEQVLTIFKLLVAETAYATYCLDGFPRAVEEMTDTDPVWPSVVQQLWSVQTQVAPVPHLFQFTASTDVLEERKGPNVTRYDLDDAQDTLVAETKDLVAYFTGRKGLKAVTISCERELADAEEDIEEALNRCIHQHG